MSQAPSMPMFWDAYLADTTHLTTEEHGAYLLLLGAMWRRNGWVPDDDRDNARILGLTVAKWRRIKSRLSDFLVFENEQISQKNLQKIWKNTQEKIQKNKENGAKGGRPKAKKNNDLIKPNGSVSDNPNETIPEPEPEPIKEESKDSLSVSPKPTRNRIEYSDHFNEWWKAYPTDANMSKAEAFKAWKNLDSADRAKALAAVPPFKAWIAKQRDYRILHAERFLKYRRFDGYADLAKPQLVHSAPEKVTVSLHENPELFDFAVNYHQQQNPNFILDGREHLKVPAPLLETFKQQKARAS